MFTPRGGRPGEGGELGRRNRREVRFMSENEQRTHPEQSPPLVTYIMVLYLENSRRVSIVLYLENSKAVLLFSI